MRREALVAGGFRHEIKTLLEMRRALTDGQEHADVLRPIDRFVNVDGPASVLPRAERQFESMRHHAQLHEFFKVSAQSDQFVPGSLFQHAAFVQDHNVVGVANG